MVTTSPIPFGPVARTVAGARTDIAGIQARQGPSIDANFAAVNAWATGMESQVHATLVTNIVAYTAPWTGSRCNGMLIGNGMVAISLTFTYTGANTTANSLGGFTGGLILGTLTDSRFWPVANAYFHFIGAMTHGQCSVEMNNAGRLRLTGGSFPYQPLNVNNFVAISGTYTPR